MKARRKQGASPRRSRGRSTRKSRKPAAEEVALSLLIDRLRDPATCEDAWPKVRSALWHWPERVTLPLCARVAEWLVAGHDVPILGSIMLCLEVKTREQPLMVPADLLRRVVADARGDWVATLCAAAMLVRHHPTAILTEGIDSVLAASEQAFGESADDSDAGDEHLTDVATRLWETVVHGDPPSIVAITEAWAARAGWHSRTVQALVKLMEWAASRNSNLIEDSMAVLQKILEEQPDASQAVDSPGAHLRTLEKARDGERRKTVAQEIVAMLDPAQFRVHPVPAPATPPEAPPDPRVDRLIEQFLQGPAWRARVAGAERRLMRATRTGDYSQVTDEDFVAAGSQEPPDLQLASALSYPWPGLVAGVCELVDDLVTANPVDDRIDLLVSQLCFALDRQPALVPVDAFRRWLARASTFDNRTRAQLYERLARVRPDWVVEQTLMDAVGTSMASSSSGVLRSLGPFYPGLLLAFADRWFERVKWALGSRPDFKADFKALAQVHPQEIDAMVQILERHQGPSPPPGTIDFRYIEFSTAVRELRQIQRTRTP